MKKQFSSLMTVLLRKKNAHFIDKSNKFYFGKIAVSEHGNDGCFAGICQRHFLSRFFMPCVALFALAIVFLCTACTQKTDTTETLRREQRFVLNYGSFEDELNLFNIAEAVDVNTWIQIQDGFIYIVNGNAKKIMQFTSYGDLLGVFYNPDTNPVPSFVATSNAKIAAENENDGKNVQMGTQYAVAYKFCSPSKIAVDSNKNIFVVDQLPQERQSFDSDANVLLRDVVLRFSREGSYLDYIGQRGVGGLPFSFVTGVHCTNNKELVVISRTTKGYTVNWFNPEGFLLYSINLETDGLPKPFNDDADYFLSLNGIYPDYNDKSLYLTIDYYESEFDITSGVQSGIAYKGSYMYTLNAETGTYSAPLELPSYEETVTEDTKKITTTKPYDFLGVSETGWLYYFTPNDKGYELQMVQNGGQKIIRRQMFVSSEELVYNTFALSKEGIIAGLLASEFEAKLVWWRTDSLSDALGR